MPGPGRQRQTRRPARPVAVAQPPSYGTPRGTTGLMGSIGRATTWDEVVDILCAHLKLPNLATRGGLKKVHLNFDAIFRSLNKLYQAHKLDDKIMRGLVAIYAKMCTDVILKKKLLQKGILDHIIPLLARQVTLPFTALSLCALSHNSHNDYEVQLRIAAQIPAMTTALAENADTTSVSAHLVCAISHGLTAISHRKESDRRLYQKLEPTFPILVESVLKALKGPGSTVMTMEHAMTLLAMLSSADAQFDAKYPGAMDLIVAGLRCASILSRGTSLCAVIVYHERGEEREVFGFDDPNFTVSKMASRPPSHLDALCEAYGRSRCNGYNMIHSAMDNQRAFARYAQDRDLYALGVELYKHTLQSDMGIAGGTMETITGRRAADLGLPFDLWTDALPHCVAAIRARQLPADSYEDMADILWITHLMLSRNYRQAAQYAREALVRNPDCAYFYYAITAGSGYEVEEGLRAAKKGLQCIRTRNNAINESPVLKFRLLQLAADHAGSLGIKMLITRPENGAKDRNWEEGIAFLMSAREDAQTFMNEAPPDDRYRTNVAYWMILLTFLLDGPKVSSDMEEVKPYLTQLGYAEEFRLFVGDKIPKTKYALSEKTIVSRYEAACKEWDPIFQRYEARVDDSDSREQNSLRTAQERAADDLTAWLEKTEDDVPLAQMKPKETESALPGINLNKVELYRCSWCRNPSAGLKKCAGCEEARYCDSGCQRAHWTDHKKICTPKKA